MSPILAPPCAMVSVSNNTWRSTHLTHQTHRPLGPGDRAPDFNLAAADVDGRVALAEYLHQGPVLLAMFRGLYCPFCRRHISQLRSKCEEMRTCGIMLLGIVVATPERARQYFRYHPPCFPVAATPDRAPHRAYGVPEFIRTSEHYETLERKAAEVLRESGVEAPPGGAGSVFAAADGFEMTAEDQSEHERPLQMDGYFLIARDGVIRWSRAEAWTTPLPKAEELIALM